jgi:hypothetical protein
VSDSPPPPPDDATDPSADPTPMLPDPICWPAPVLAAHATTARWAAARYRLLLDRMVPAPVIDRFGIPLGIPVYGSPAFTALPERDPRRDAAVLNAAETWRQYTAEAPARLHRQLADDHRAATVLFQRWEAEQAQAFRELAREVRSWANRPTWPEQQQLRQLPAARPVRATAGWTPVAIPGRLGWWRHLAPDGSQLDLPTEQAPDAATWRESA